MCSKVTMFNAFALPLKGEMLSVGMWEHSFRLWIPIHLLNVWNCKYYSGEPWWNMRGVQKVQIWPWKSRNTKVIKCLPITQFSGLGLQRRIWRRLTGEVSKTAITDILNHALRSQCGGTLVSSAKSGSRKGFGCISKKLKIMCDILLHANMLSLTINNHKHMKHQLHGQL